MVNRFRSGAEGINTARAGRVFRGATVAQQDTTTDSSIDTNTDQLARVIEEQREVQAELDALKRATSENQFQGDGAIISRREARRIQVRSAELGERFTALQEAREILESGRSFQDFSQVEQIVEQRGESARDFQRNKISRGFDIRRRREQRKSSAKQAQFQENPDGSFFVTDKKGITRAFTREGKEVPLQSAVEDGEAVLKGQIIEEQAQTNEGQVASLLRLQSKAEKPQLSKLDQVFNPPVVTEFALAEKLASQTINKFSEKLFTVKPVTPLAASFQLTKQKTFAGQLVKDPVGVAKGFALFELTAGSVMKSFSVATKTAQRIRTRGISLRPPKTPRINTKVATGKIGDKLFTISTFKIIAERAPPRITSQAGKPLIEGIKIRSPIRTVTQPRAPIINNKPFTALTARQGSKIANLQFVGGTRAIRINPQNTFVSSQKFDRLLIQQLQKISLGKTVNKPLFSSERQFFKGEVVTLSKPTVDFGRKEVALKLNRFKTQLQLRPTLKTPEVQRFQTFQVFKDVTKTGARATGRLPKLKGTLTVFREPIVFSGRSFKQSFGVSPSKLKTTTSQKLAVPMISPSIVAKQTGTASSIPTPKTPKGVIPQRAEIKTRTPSTISLTKQVSIQNTVPSTRTVYNIRTKQTPRVVTVTRQTSGTRNIIRQPQTQKIVQIQNVKTTIRTPVKTEQKFRTPIIPPTTIIPIKRPPKTPPTKNPPLIPFKLPQGRRSRVSTSPLFPVFARRRGVFRAVGAGRTRQEAVRIGARFTSQSLSAVFKIGGRGSGSLSTPRGFKQVSRGGQTLFVEQPKFRLDTPTERLQLKLERRRRRR